MEEAGPGPAVMDVHAAARFVSALRKLEYAAGRYHAGSLLLAQDPLELSRRAAAAAFPASLPLYRKSVLACCLLVA